MDYTEVKSKEISKRKTLFKKFIDFNIFNPKKMHINIISCLVLLTLLGVQMISSYPLEEDDNGFDYSYNNIDDDSLSFYNQFIKRGGYNTPFRWGKRTLGNIPDQQQQSYMNELCKRLIVKYKQYQTSKQYPKRMDDEFLAIGSNAQDNNFLRLCLKISQIKELLKTNDKDSSLTGEKRLRPPFKWGKRDMNLDDVVEQEQQQKEN